MRASARPSTPTMAASKAIAAAAPSSTLRHPRTQPTASTTVSASTHSTSEAKNDDTTVVPSQVHAPGSSPTSPKCISPLKSTRSPGALADRAQLRRRSTGSQLPEYEVPITIDPDQRVGCLRRRFHSVLLQPAPHGHLSLLCPPALARVY